jgi:hypothetical protein
VFEPASAGAWAPPSFAVDLAHLQAGIRPVIRSRLPGDMSQQYQFRRWARQSRLFAVVDNEGYFALSRRRSAASRVLRIDRLPGDHTFVLGRALGYPSCCCTAAARHGESRLDAWAAEQSAREFVGEFRLISPAGYGEGTALISHVPCSPCCIRSLQMARAARKHLQESRHLRQSWWQRRKVSAAEER